MNCQAATCCLNLPVYLVMTFATRCLSEATTVVVSHQRAVRGRGRGLRTPEETMPEFEEARRAAGVTRCIEIWMGDSYGWLDLVSSFLVEVFFWEFGSG